MKEPLLNKEFIDKNLILFDKLKISTLLDIDKVYTSNKNHIKEDLYKTINSENEKFYLFKLLDLNFIELLNHGKDLHKLDDLELCVYRQLIDEILLTLEENNILVNEINDNLIFDEKDYTIYAGFLKRFGAYFLDNLFKGPWLFLIIYINNASRLNEVLTFIPSLIFFFFYNIYCVKRWGGTPGKLSSKIKIVKVNGDSVGWREAILRHIVDITLFLVIKIALIIVLFKMNDNQFNAMTYPERLGWIVMNMPVWYLPLTRAISYWAWSEFIVLLFNKKKRAIHDYIAGTVVIIKNRMISENKDCPYIKCELCNKIIIKEEGQIHLNSIILCNACWSKKNTC